MEKKKKNQRQTLKSSNNAIKSDENNFNFPFPQQELKLRIRGCFMDKSPGFDESYLSYRMIVRERAKTGSQKVFGWN